MDSIELDDVKLEADFIAQVNLCVIEYMHLVHLVSLEKSHPFVVSLSEVRTTVDLPFIICLILENE